jgi:hypothetical protein
VKKAIFMRAYMRDYRRGIRRTKKEKSNAASVDPTVTAGSDD